ncbi:unnamed protein product, partial [Choristocarpus tenellus]
LEHQGVVLKEQLRQLENRHQRYKCVADTNRAMIEETKEALSSMESRSKSHEENVHEMQKDMVSLRQDLISTFRKALKDLEGSYRSKAFDALDVNSKIRIRSNIKLRKELTVQDHG